ncbi:MAG TPA: glycerol-3-phosphate 1-O-acyltransferase PlsY [Gemmatimonadaceae bacterium]|nr:glycerol-3-phosphate 1-O-acyltransferase PlsY [Gemmatimonadaceae bacterium]
MTRLLLALAVSYVLGSISFAYLAGRLKGMDLRRHGSGNLGATNVLRTLGAPWAAAVLALDAAKGVAAVLLVPRLLGPGPEAWPLACGVAAIGGHVWPVFLRFRGGKGVATAAGAFAALAPVPFLAALAAFGLVLLATRYMSLGSLTGAAVLPVGVALLRGARDPLFFVSVGVALFVFWTHRANLDRLRRGVEPRVGQKTVA